MLSLANRLESLTRGTGICLAWLTLAMVLVTSIIVAQRYLFDAGSIALQESVIFMHAAAFMLASAYTLASGDHVRVDIFYSRFSERGKAIVNLLGVLTLLVPFCIFLIWTSWDFVSVSWSVREASQESGGLPFPFPAIVKSFIPAAAVLLILQGIVMALRAIVTLRSPESD